MECYAVVKVCNNYDEVDNVECVKVFPIEQEANDFIQESREKAKESYLERYRYIENFVENLNPPEMDYFEWVQYLEKYLNKNCRYVQPTEFKQVLKRHLHSGYFTPEGFDPPKNYTMDNLFVVKIEHEPFITLKESQ